MVIFKKIDSTCLEEVVVKNFFNCLTSSLLDEAFSRLESHQSFGDEYHYCLFEEDIDDDDEPFEGVKISFMDDDVVITLNKLSQYISEAKANRSTQD